MNLDTIDPGFLEALKASRTSALIKGKGKAKYPKVNTTWKYPILLERKYSNWAVKLFDPIRKVCKQFAKDYPALLAKYRKDGDDWGYHTDASAVDLTFRLRSDLEAAQEEMDLYPASGLPGATEATIYGVGAELADWSGKRWALERQLALGHVYDIQEPWMQETLRDWTATNSGYFKNLSREWVGKMEALALDALQTGKRPEQLTVDIWKMDKSLGFTRAKLIAQDQLGKLYAITNEKRSLACGMDTYTWVTSHDERVRPSHRDAEGKVGIYGNSSVWLMDGKQVPRNGEGDESSPGVPIRCRCHASARWEDVLKPIDESLLSDPWVEAEIARMSGK